MLVFATLFMFAACKGNSGKPKETDPYSPEEFQSGIAHQQSIAASIAAEAEEAESERQEEVDKYVAKIGKTKKNSQLVVEMEVPDFIGREYWKFVFDKKGILKYKLTYNFYATEENYRAMVDAAKGHPSSKLYEKDDDMRMVVTKSTDFAELDYEEMYKRFINNGTIIE